ncbi:hypothetical protein VNO77_09824 [Canavalia gladiata]|uniref:Uncharacterized protein n=1 Tax=Canavalia gladiata TaxID=3824 RepID=A0AAN9MF54_CANGL
MSHDGITQVLSVMFCPPTGPASFASMINFLWVLDMSLSFWLVMVTSQPSEHEKDFMTSGADKKQYPTFRKTYSKYKNIQLANGGGFFGSPLLVKRLGL